MIMSDKKVIKCLLKDDFKGDIVLSIVVKEINIVGYGVCWNFLKVVNVL